MVKKGYPEIDLMSLIMALTQRVSKLEKSFSKK